jgi:renalase
MSKPMGQSTNFAIIGAGMAGLACARQLHAAGHGVTVFDKGRGPGGRMSTRRVTTSLGEVSFDHGAQYFTARDPDFLAHVQAMIKAGAVDRWQGTLVSLLPDGTNHPLASEPLYVGTPGMNGIVREMSKGLDVRWGVQVAGIAALDNGWSLQDANGNVLEEVHHVICAVPAEQVAPLLQDCASELANQAKAIGSQPCWAAMFVTERPFATPFDAIRFKDHPILDFYAANHSKPARGEVCAYVVHATAQWSQTHLEDSPEAIAQALLTAVRDYSDNQPECLFATAHRWRYAKVTVSHGPVYAYDKDARIGLCGDYLCGPRIESAWLSGHGLAKALA